MGTRLARRCAVLGVPFVCTAALAAFACIPDLPSETASSGDGGLDATADVDAQPQPPRCGDGIIQLANGEQCDPGKTLAPDATAGGCTGDCKMVCGGFVWDGGNDHCYTLDPHMAGALDGVASVDCANAGAHVVTFASETELDEVVSKLNPGGPFWVGMDPFPGYANEYFSLASFEPGWAPTCPGCFAHTADPTAPLPGSPQGCIESQSDLDASWEQYPCSDAGKIHVVCEREPAGVSAQKCDGGYCIDLPFTFGKKRYLFVNAPQLGAAAAEAQCESLGGSLVVLQSRDEREQLWYELSKLTSPGSVWIGLSQKNGNWVWADDAGVDAYPSPFAASPPSGIGSQAYLTQTTVEIPQPPGNTLAHNDDVDTTTLAYVCQLPPTDSGF